MMSSGPVSLSARSLTRSRSQRLKAMASSTQPNVDALAGAGRIQPKYVGNAVSLSETLTFVSVLFWAVVLGPIGAILAVPLTLPARTILLDSDPSLSWWRPRTGDKKDLEPILKLEDDAIRARRARRGPGGADPGGTRKA